MLILAAAAALAGTSQLWGEAGELWDPVGRLPDFSWAGYHAGEDEIPEVSITADVRDFGAVGDGITDDTDAFRAALAGMAPGALWIPEGTWRLTDVIEITRSGVVLRGAGPDRTVLAFSVSLTDVRGAAAQWSWNGGLIWIRSPESGTDLTIVSTPAARGDRELTVDDAGGLAPGQLVVLDQVDDGTSLGRHLYGEQADPGDCAYQVPLRLDWITRIAAVEGSVVTLVQPLRNDVRLDWSPRLRSLPALTEVGVEHLAVAFPDVPYAGHLAEPGYNGIFLRDGVVDGWIRDVRFLNTDNAVLPDRLTKWLTVQDVRIEGRPGHHGFNVAFGSDHLVQRVHFAKEHVHALTVDHRTHGNVFRGITADDGVTVQLDHHKDSPFENLFTAIDAPTSWISGGSTCAGPNGGARETFWNLRGPVYRPWWGHLQNNLVGQLDDPVSVLTDDREWYEHVEDLRPRDLYLAQRAVRLGLDLPDTGDPPDSGSDALGPRRCGCGGGGAWLLLLALAALRRKQSLSGVGDPAGRS